MILTRNKLSMRFISGMVGVLYVLICIAYFPGKEILLNKGLEYQYWIEILLRFIIWFVPLILAGVLLLRARKKTEKGRRAAFTVVFVIYSIVAIIFSFGYILFNAFTVSTDEKMQDGNLVVTVPNGLENTQYYAEPVGIFCRREIIFDEGRLADSLSKIYDVNFQFQKSEDGDIVFVSDMYPGIEVQIMQNGYTKSTYLDNNFKYELTNQQIEEHRDIFEENGVEFVSYVYGKTKSNPEGFGICHAVLITNENKEKAAKSITDFILTTLSEDVRHDGESYWRNVDGSIFLVAKDQETGEPQSLRNIPFSLNPNHSWILDESVTSEEVLKEITNALK